VNGFFCQAVGGIRDFHVTGVQTCALPISPCASLADPARALSLQSTQARVLALPHPRSLPVRAEDGGALASPCQSGGREGSGGPKIGRASRRESGTIRGFVIN